MTESHAVPVAGSVPRAERVHSAGFLGTMPEMEERSEAALLERWRVRLKAPARLRAGEPIPATLNHYGPGPERVTIAGPEAREYDASGGKLRVRTAASA